MLNDQQRVWLPESVRTAANSRLPLMLIEILNRNLINSDSLGDADVAVSRFSLFSLRPLAMLTDENPLLYYPKTLMF